MKSLKPLLLLLAGVLITVALFSFKNQQTQREFCRMEYAVDYRMPISIAYGDRIDKFNIPKDSESKIEALKLLNKLTSEGWQVLSIASSGASSSNSLYDIIYFERTKQ